MLPVLEQAQAWNPDLSLAEAWRQLGLSRATVYRWRTRAQRGELADRVAVPSRRALPPIPEEVPAVVAYARANPLLGYKRLAWAMVDEGMARLRPWMVHQVLAKAGLLARRRLAPEGLRRPAEAAYPDQRWHTDPMSLYFAGRWFWLVSVLDAYSRYLVH